MDIKIGDFKQLDVCLFNANGKRDSMMSAVSFVPSKPISFMMYGT